MARHLMSNREAVTVAKQGGYVRTLECLHDEEDKARSRTCDHQWHVIAYDDDTNIEECIHCGKQQVDACGYVDEIDWRDDYA